MARWGGRKSQDLLRLTISEYGARCHICKGAIRLDLPPGHPDGPSADHIVPRSRGGSDDLSNLRPAHKRCNSRRGVRSLTTTQRLPESGAGFSLNPTPGSPASFHFLPVHY